MFEKDKANELYNREEFTYEEKIYIAYIKMRKTLHELEKFKYGVEDNILKSEEFKQGFIAGLKIMSSILIDM